MSKILVIGASRGLGEALAKQYASGGSHVYGTARSSSPPQETTSLPITWIGNVDVSSESAGSTIADGLKGTTIDTVFITAGYFGKESFDEPNFEAEVQMYKISSIGPVFMVHHLVKARTLRKGSKVILLSSESGSITLRHESEGGGMFGHHASKTALNMVGKLLSLDLKDRGIAVCLLHPGFMRTEMTRSVGFDKFWDAGGAVTPDEAATSIREFVDKIFDISMTGQYWAPRGPG